MENFTCLFVRQVVLFYQLVKNFLEFLLCEINIIEIFNITNNKKLKVKIYFRKILSNW